MVQELPSDIPEELYNLTQLAYVSYEAPKLNTETRERTAGTADEKDHLRRRAHEPLEHEPAKRRPVPYYDASSAMINLLPAEYYTPAVPYRTSMTHSDDGRIVIVQELRTTPTRPVEASNVTTMAEPTKKKWTKKWEIIQGPARESEPAPPSTGQVELLPVEWQDQATSPGPGSLSPGLDAGRDTGRDAERSSLILYAPTIRSPQKQAPETVTASDKDVQLITIIECSAQPENAISEFGVGQPATSPAVGGGVSASEESQDSAVVECYYSHKVFDRKKARKIRTESCTSSLSVGAASAGFGLLDADGSSLDRLIVAADDGGPEVCGVLDRSRDATNDSGHVEADPASSVGGNVSDENNVHGPGQDVHVCPECNKRYSTSSNLARHRQTHRSLEDKKARKCPFCSKVYVSMPAYSMHVRTHNQGCECPTCGKCFSRPWLLQGHIRTHTGEKPFQCTVCHKAFADKSNLRAHVQTHSNTKPHACGRCGKSFALKSYLYKHEDSSCLKNERPPKAPKPAASGRPRRKGAKDRPATITSPSDEQARPAAAVSTPSTTQTSGSDGSVQSAGLSQNVRDVVRAKIREVVEDNCKKAAAAAAASTTATMTSPIPVSPVQSVSTPATAYPQDNRISVIRIAGSASGSSLATQPIKSPPPDGNPENYAVIA